MCSFKWPTTRKLFYYQFLCVHFYGKIPTVNGHYFISNKKLPTKD